MNHFKFHSVGQGLFYTGTIGDAYRFVYDCGTSTNQLFVQREINAFVASTRCKNPRVDFAVISHLHYDHYSGINYLLNECRVRKLLLPYFPNEMSLLRLCLYYNALVQDDQPYEDCVRAVETLVNLYERAYGRNDMRNEEFGPERVLLPETESAEAVDYSEYTLFTESNRERIDGKLEWEFVFAHKVIKNIAVFSKALKVEFERQSGLVFSDAAFVEYLKNGKARLNKIKKLYHAVFGKNFDLNLTSTVLLHFPREKASLFAPKNYSSPYWCVCEHNNEQEGYIFSLLSGDVMFDRALERSLFAGVIERYQPESILILQVPHHGSARNWGSVKQNGICAHKYVASFGLGNSFSHPSKAFISDMICYHLDYSLVTQIASYEYWIER